MLGKVILNLVGKVLLNVVNMIMMNVVCKGCKVVHFSTGHAHQEVHITVS